jgi:hypothetical protein
MKVKVLTEYWLSLSFSRLVKRNIVMQQNGFVETSLFSDNPVKAL